MKETVKKLIYWIYSSEAKATLQIDTLFTQLIQKVCEFSKDDAIEVWSDGTELLLPDLETANAIADALDETLDIITVTGGYTEDGVVDRYSGWHYITF